MTFFKYIFLLLASSHVFAAPPHWEIVPNQSSLTFTAIQNDAPVSGKFNKFRGDINVDPNQLENSHIRIVVDIASLSTSYQDLTDTLITSDWFDTKTFPQAVFEAKKFTKTGSNTYTAEGTLTIRDKTIPIVLNVVQDEYALDKARVHGDTILKRNDFGVGQGEWSSTKEVKDEVKVEYKLSAVKK